jgi:DNA topoisomerase-1
VETKETHKTGAEKNKISATPLGISVTECLQAGFADLFDYAYTAQMESGLDQISQGAVSAWTSILQDTWDAYKDRYEAALAEKDARVQTLGSEAVKVVQTKKGPLLVRPSAEDPSKSEFAPLPAGVTAANAATKLTAEVVEAAFSAAKEAKEGELLGHTDAGEEIRKKKGPYGAYVQSGDTKVPWKPEDTLDALKAKLEAKATAFERHVGPYIIKQGPYGYYFYLAKSVGGKGKPKFVGVPKDKDPATITEAELAEATKEAPAKKKAFSATKKTSA